MSGGNSTLNPNATIFVPNNVFVNLVPLNIQVNLPNIDSIQIIPLFRNVSTPHCLDGNDNWLHNDLEMLVRNNVFLAQSKRFNPKADPFYPGVVNEDAIQAPFERMDLFPISLNPHKVLLKTRYNSIFNFIPLISYSLNPRSDTFIPRSKCHVFNPHADTFTPNFNGSNVTTNPKVVELISATPAVVNEVAGDTTPKEIISGNFDNFDKSILNISLYCMKFQLLHYQKWRLGRVTPVRHIYCIKFQHLYYQKWGFGRVRTHQSVKDIVLARYIREKIL